MPTAAAAVELRARRADDPAWLAFLGTHPEATAFHHPAWSRVLTESYGYRPLVLVETTPDGEIVAGLPLLEVQHARAGPRFSSLPFTDHCPPLTTDADGLSRLSASLVRWQRARGARQVCVHDALVPRAGVQVIPRAVQHVLPLESSSQAQLDRLKGTQVHRAIRKAQREGVETRLSRSYEDLCTFYRLHVQTRRRQGVPVQPRRFLDRLWTHLIDRGLGFVVLASYRERAIAGALFLAWNGTLIYKFGASDPRSWEHRPNNLVMWTAIEWGCAHAYRRLDFGRTDLDNQGLRDFKSRWGARELPLAYSYLAPAPAHAAPAFVMRTMARVIRSSPPIVCRMTGELLYGRLPGFTS